MAGPVLGSVSCGSIALRRKLPEGWVLTAGWSGRSRCLTNGIGAGPTVATLALPDGMDTFPESCDNERTGFTEAPVLPLLAGTGVLEGEGR